MKLIDLTHIITEGMPVYPGTEAPILAPANTIPVDGFQEKKITMYSHTGTHMDAPAHLVPGAATLDQLPLDTFYGRACVLDFPTKNEPLLIHEKSIVGNDFLLLRCGWDKKWGTGEYFVTEDKISELQERDYYPMRILVRDINGDGKNDVITVKNKRFSEMISFRKFTQGEIEIRSWDGIGLAVYWRTRKLSGYLSDFAIGDFDNDGKDELVATLVMKTGSVVLTDAKSKVIAYELQ